MTGRKSATGLLTAVLVVTAFPLDFAGKLRVLRTKFLPGALHAIEGSGVSFRLLQILMLPGPGKMPLAHVCAVLSLLDGPPGCDPGFFFVWCRWAMNYRNAQDEPIVFRQLQDFISQFPFLAPSVFNLYVSKSEIFKQDMSEPEPEAESEAETGVRGRSEVGEVPPKHWHVHVASGDAQVPDSFLRPSETSGRSPVVGRLHAGSVCAIPHPREDLRCHRTEGFLQLLRLMA